MQALPKIELHRHLEGSIRLSTLVEVAQEYGIEMPEYDVELLRPFVQMMPTETHNSQHFLAKFMTIRQFFLSEAVIRRMTREVVADAATDNVKYLELRFTPRALSNILRLSLRKRAGLGVQLKSIAAETRYGIQVRLIVSVNRHESLSHRGFNVGRCAGLPAALTIVAVDLAGNEKDFRGRTFSARGSSEQKMKI